MEIDNIITDFKRKYSRSAILSKVNRDREMPYGVIIGLLRDYYNIPKTQGCELTDKLLKEYNLIIGKDYKHSQLRNEYNKYKNLLQCSTIRTNRNIYAKECKILKTKMVLAQKEYSDFMKIINKIYTKKYIDKYVKIQGL